MESDSLYNGIVHVEMSQSVTDSLDDIPDEDVNPLALTDGEEDPLACEVNPPYEDCPNLDLVKFETFESSFQSEETSFLQNDDLPLQNDDLALQNDDLALLNNDLPLQNDDLPHQNDDLHHQNGDLPHQNDDLPHQNDVKMECENYDSDSEPGDLEIDSGTFSDSLNEIKTDPDGNYDLEASSLVKIEFGEDIVKKEPEPMNDKVTKGATITNADGVKIYRRKLPEHTYHSHLITKDNIQHEDVAKTKRNIFTCKHCLFKTLYKKIYVTHMKKIHSILVFACELCNFHYTTKEVTQEHIKIKHKIFKFFDCPKCDHFCIDEKKVRYHMRLNHSKRKLSCPQCTYTSDCKANINRHIKAVHSLGKPFKCQSCNYSTTCQLFLDSHIQRRHSKDKNYTCSFCSEKFVHQNYLAKHIQLLHMGSDYKCSFCSFTSPLHAKLRNHLVDEHADKGIFLNAGDSVEKPEIKTEVV